MLTLYTRIPIRFRLALTLVCILTGAILFADWIGIFPNARRQLVQGRISLCESLAVSGTAMVAQGNVAGFRSTVETLVDRNRNLRSVRLVNDHGNVVFDTPGHDDIWSTAQNDLASNLSVPIFRFGEPWGTLQVAFVEPQNELAYARYGMWGLLVFAVPLCFVQFSFFLKRMIAALNPEGAVPDSVRSFMDCFAEGLVLIDEKERILIANRRLCDALGTTQNELFGKTVGELGFLIGDDKSQWPWDEAMQQEKLVSERILKLKRQQNDSEVVSTFSVTCNPFPGEGLMATFDDITEIEENKAKLAVALGVAKDASEAKSAFLANMSHEIRTPLNAVLGFTDVLRRGLVTDSEEAISHLNMIHRSGAHLLELINDILDLSKIEAGRMQVEAIPTQIDEVILDAVNVQSVKAQEKEIELNIEFLTDLPSVVHCDPTRLRQIVTNLIGNAIKFTDLGGVTVRVECAGQLDNAPSAQDNCLSIHVDDTGIGMTPDQQEKIFDSFVQADCSTTRKFGGTGLGLSISRRLAEAMGGELTVQSVSEKGSTFSLSIPVDQKDAKHWTKRDVLNKRAERRENTSSIMEIRKLPPKKILVVDDGEANRQLIELVLSRAGAVVSCAEDGQQAIDMIEQQSFELVFMDMQMPVLDGMSATRQLRDSGNEIPIVALTGNAMKGDREKCLGAGCDDFLSKPVNLDELLKCCVHFLGEPTSPDVPAIDTAYDAAPIHSKLPLDDEEMHQIVRSFVERLDNRLDEMHRAVQMAEFSELKSDAHWLKGSGGTVGYSELTAPAKLLEQAAEDEDAEIALAVLDEIQSIRSRMVLPGIQTDPAGQNLIQNTDHSENQPSPNPPQPDTDAPVIECDLPLDDPDYLMIVTGFIDRFDQRLAAMKDMVSSESFQELADEGHWLKGAGGTVGFPCFTEPAFELMTAARNGDRQACEQHLQNIVQLRSRLKLPSPSNPSFIGQ